MEISTTQKIDTIYLYPGNHTIICGNELVHPVIRRAYEQNTTLLEFINEIINVTGSNMWKLFVSKTIFINIGKFRNGMNISYDIMTGKFYQNDLHIIYLNNLDGLTLDENIRDLFDPITKLLTLDIQNNNEYKMQVFVKTLTGKSLTIYIESTSTVFELKKLIQSKEGIPPNQQRLIFYGRQLEDNKTLEYHKIYKECTIHLCLNMRGGMHHISSGHTDYCSTRVPDQKNIIDKTTFISAIHLNYVKKVGNIYKKLFLQLNCHPKCPFERIELITQIETSDNYFQELNLEEITNIGNILELLSDASILKYTQRLAQLKN